MPIATKQEELIMFALFLDAAAPALRVFSVIAAAAKSGVESSPTFCGRRGARRKKSSAAAAANADLKK